MKHITIKSSLMRIVAVMLLISGTASASAQYYMNVVQKNGEKIQYLVSNIDSVYFSGQKGSAVNYEYVDLGLSVKWATFNVGATKPEEYGDYYAWGETETKTDYSWFTYKWCNGSNATLTKYCSIDNVGNECFTDTLTVLAPEDDVAHVKWGGSWRMPTKAEQDDLHNKCAWTWYDSGNTEFNGVAGYKVTSKIEGYTDRSIFLPAPGYRYGTNFDAVANGGHYWSSSLDTGYPIQAYFLYFDSEVVDWSCNFRLIGYSVRPVCP